MTPMLDIVMPVHDQAGWVDLAVRAVEHHTRNPYRLIIVDNASVEPATRMILRGIADRGHTVVSLPENRSFSNAINAGVRAGSAPTVIVLNDDAIVTEGWDGALLQDCGTPGVGLVGARSNFAAGAQGDPTFVGEPPYLVFVCVAFRRAVWEQIGPMDEDRFDGWSGEDLDYSWRVQAAGFRLKVSNAFVLHAGSRTLAATVGDAYARAKNDEKYLVRLAEKWGEPKVKAAARLRPLVFVSSFHAEEWTRVRFMGALLCLKRSDGVSFNYYQHTRTPIPIARQATADYALDAGYDVHVMMDDDALFPSDVLRLLLRHDVDVVTALAYQRKPPHWTCLFKWSPDGKTGLAMEGIEHTGLRRVDATGLHVAVIKTSVYRRLREAGLKHWFGRFNDPEVRGEDFTFSGYLRDVGIPIHADTDVIAGHIGAETVIDEAYKRAFMAQSAPAPTAGGIVVP